MSGLFAPQPVRYLPDDEFEAAKRENLDSHVMCRVKSVDDKPLVCMGYHCQHCGASVGMMGHNNTCRIKRLSEQEAA